MSDLRFWSLAFCGVIAIVVVSLYAVDYFLRY